jgi:hypothetical protein
MVLEDVVATRSLAACRLSLVLTYAIGRVLVEWS